MKMETGGEGEDGEGEDGGELQTVARETLITILEKNNY